MADRWAIYDFDADELATTNTYSTYGAACDDADQLNNVIVLNLGDVAPGPR